MDLQLFVIKVMIWSLVICKTLFKKLPHICHDEWIGENPTYLWTKKWIAPLKIRIWSHCSSVQLLSHVQLFVTPWTAPRQASLSITNSQSLLKLMSIESVMPYNHIILCCPLVLLPSVFPASGSLSVSWLFTSGGQSICLYLDYWGTFIIIWF